MQTILETVQEQLQQAQSAIIDEERFGSLVAPGGPEPGPAERRSWLLDLQRRSAENSRARGKLVEQLVALRPASGEQHTRAEAAVAKALQQQADALDRWRRDHVAALTALTTCVPPNIPAAEERLRHLALPPMNIDTSAPLAELQRMRREASWSELAAWTWACKVRL